MFCNSIITLSDFTFLPESDAAWPRSKTSPSAAATELEGLDFHALFPHLIVRIFLLFRRCNFPWLAYLGLPKMSSSVPGMSV